MYENTSPLRNDMCKLRRNYRICQKLPLRKVQKEHFYSVLFGHHVDVWFWRFRQFKPANDEQILLKLHFEKKVFSDVVHTPDNDVHDEF